MIAILIGYRTVIRLLSWLCALLNEVPSAPTSQEDESIPDSSKNTSVSWTRALCNGKIIFTSGRIKAAARI